MEYYFYLWSFIEKKDLQLCRLVRETVSKCPYVTLRNFAVHSCSVVFNALSLHGLTTPCTVAHHDPLSMGISRQEYQSGLTCPLPGIFLTRDGTQVSCMQGDSLYSLSCQLLIKQVLKYTEDLQFVYLFFPATVGFFPANISVQFPFT